MEGTACFICLKLSPMTNEHHIWMQAAGGQEGPTVTLCPSCHQGIHSCALNLLSKSAKRKQFFTEEEMKRAAPLIRYIMLALQQKREGKIKGTKSKVIIDVDAQFLVLLHALKADAGFSNLSSFCANVLRDYARRRF
jgi:hypothetical protein